VYLVHLKVASVKANSYHAPFSVPVTAVLMAIMKKTQLINELEHCSYYGFPYLGDVMDISTTF